MKKASTVIMLTLLALALFGGLAVAQSTYFPTPTPPAIPGLPEVSPPLPDLPGVPPEGTRIGMLERYEIILTAGGASETINATIPPELEPYEVVWVSNDTSVATVTAQSAATVTPVGVGECLVYIFVTTDDESYYDFALVRVLDADEAVPTPPTSGGTAHITAALIGLLLIFTALALVRRLRLVS